MANKLVIRKHFQPFKPTLRPENNDSKTRPNMALSLRQIMNKHGVGGIFANGKEPLYYGDVEMPTLEKMDLADVRILQEQIEEKIALARAKQLEAKDKKDRSDREKQVEELAEKKAQELLSRKRFTDPKDKGDPEPNK